TYPVPVTLTANPPGTTIPVSVTFNPSNGSPISDSNTATVTNGPLAVAVFPIVGTEGNPVASNDIATFVDAGGANPPASYTAHIFYINSGGRATTVTDDAEITQVGSAAQYIVTAPDITFPEEGTYQLLVEIDDNSGATPISVRGASTATIADA